jgi:Ca2+/H+ antiporter, TMEM165/GDT1 family
VHFASIVAATPTTSDVVLVLAVFGASAVEMVEALTIVLAVGTTAGWRTALQGAGAALALLAVLVAAGGVPLVHWVPLSALRVGVGAVLLLLGLEWLGKAVLRAAGVIARHDEDLVYAETVRALRASGQARREGLAVSFKGVLLEGVEVVVIVISTGASQHRLAPAAGAAAAAAVVVAGAGLLLARQLSAVPENALKLVVGVMLSSFGLFWAGEGARVHWPGSDATLPVLVAGFLALAGVLTLALRRHAVALAPPSGATPEAVPR